MTVWFGPLAWMLAVGLGWGVSVLPGYGDPWAAGAAALVGSVLVWGIERAWVRRPLAAVRHRLEALAEGVEGGADLVDAGPPPIRALSAATRRVASRALRPPEAPASAWALAAARLDAVDRENEVAPGIDPGFEAALSRLRDRREERLRGLRTTTRELAFAAVEVLERLRAQSEAWAGLAGRMARWEEVATDISGSLEAGRGDFEAARDELSRRATAQVEGERRLEDTLRSAAARLARVAQLEGDVRNGAREIERLERSITALARVDRADHRMERLGEAKAALAHLSEARAERAAELARVRDSLESLAELIPVESPPPSADRALRDGFSQLSRLADSWGDVVRGLRASAVDGGVDLDRLESSERRIRRLLVELEPLLLEVEFGRSFEEALLARLEAEGREHAAVRSGELEMTEGTRRALEQLEARAREVRARLDALAASGSGAGGE